MPKLLSVIESKLYTIKDLRRAASRVGATVEDNSTKYELDYQVMSPHGKFWKDSNSVHLAVYTYKNDLNQVSSTIQDAIERIEFGLYDPGKEEYEYQTGEKY